MLKLVFRLFLGTCAATSTSQSVLGTTTAKAKIENPREEASAAAVAAVTSDAAAIRPSQRRQERAEERQGALGADRQIHQRAGRPRTTASTAPTISLAWAKGEKSVRVERPSNLVPQLELLLWKTVWKDPAAVVVDSLTDEGRFRKTEASATTTIITITIMVTARERLVVLRIGAKEKRLPYEAAL
jgi:uncharacterized DUF497 family protein